MNQHYSDPTRENDPHALPDVEIWETGIVEINSNCGVFEVPDNGDDARGFCPSCERATCVHDLDDDPAGIVHTNRTGWFYWFCFPGCMPEGSPVGPFTSETDALADARGE